MEPSFPDEHQEFLEYLYYNEAVDKHTTQWGFIIESPCVKHCNNYNAGKVVITEDSSFYCYFIVIAECVVCREWVESELIEWDADGREIHIYDNGTFLEGPVMEPDFDKL